MPTIIQTTKRQVEILSSILSKPGEYSPVDLELQFNVSKATMERDLQQLRSWGIDVHSIRGKLHIDKPIPVKRSVELLSLYVSLSASESPYHKSLTLLYTQLKEEAFNIFVTLSRAIERSKAVRFTYVNPETSKEQLRKIYPYGISLLGKRWVLAGYLPDRKEMRHFSMENISAPTMLNETFKPKGDFSLAKFYEDVWGRWKDEKEYAVKIWFDPTLQHLMTTKVWHTHQKIRKQKDGSIIFEARVSGLYEIMNWVLPWGKYARVLEPAALVDMIKKHIEEMTSVYR